jgi:hypothetical protein
MRFLGRYLSEVADAVIEANKPIQEIPSI